MVASNSSLPKAVISGNEAVALAALDAGVTFASSYPGTPTTDILETLQRQTTRQIPCSWSVNEKVAYESSLAVAIAGKRSLVAMKHVGLNVAADAFINSCPSGVNAGFVIAIGDDPGIQSSSNKQDSRHYSDLSGAPLLEPCDPQEAYDMTRAAFQLSEAFRIPVMLRLPITVAYSTSHVLRSRSEPPVRTYVWPKEPRRFLVVPGNVRPRTIELMRVQPKIAEWIATSPFSTLEEIGSDTGIVCTGIGYQHAREHFQDTDILKVAGEPFPGAILRDFADRFERVIVLEEGDPRLESRVRLVAKRNAVVLGRLSGHLTISGELNSEEVRCLATGEKPSAATSQLLPARLPEICKPCAYNKVFAAVRELSDVAIPGDIGCNTLGGIAPYSALDGIWAMGSSIGVACGLAAIGHKRILAIIGDSTFFHAGIPALIEAVRQQLSMTVLLLDNGTTAMTGGQPVPHNSANQIDLLRLIEALGVRECQPFDPHRLGPAGIKILIEETFSRDGVKVLMYRSQCGIYNPGYYTTPPHAITKESAS